MESAVLRTRDGALVNSLEVPTARFGFDDLVGGKDSSQRSTELISRTLLRPTARGGSHAPVWTARRSRRRLMPYRRAHSRGEAALCSLMVTSRMMGTALFSVRLFYRSNENGRG
jgi:hypothetical protein